MDAANIRATFALMIRLLLLTSFLVFSSQSFAQNLTWQWALQGTGTGYDFGRTLLTDNSGNMYVCGRFSSMTFNLGSHTLNNSGGGANDLFLAKYDASGNISWITRIAGGYMVTGMTSDRVRNIYLTGYSNYSFLGFGGSTGLFNPNSGTNFCFLAKYDPAGNVLWAIGGQGNAQSMTSGVTTDEADNIYVTGIAIGYGKTFTIGAKNVANINSYSSVFVFRCDTAGNVFWCYNQATQYTNSDQIWPTAIQADKAGHFYLSGYFYGAKLVIGTDTLVNHSQSNTSDVFLAKYDTAGQNIWATSFGGSKNDQDLAIAIGRDQTIAVGGSYYSDTIRLGTDTLTKFPGSSAYSDLFVAKFDSSGSALWGRAAGGNSEDQVFDVKMDSASNTYITGYTESQSVIFGSDTLRTNGANLSYIAQFDTAGNCNWGFSPISAISDNQSYGLTLGAGTDIYITGLINQTTNFGANVLANPVQVDAYLAKADRLATSTHSMLRRRDVGIYPNPAGNFFYLECSGKIEGVECFNSMGERMPWPQARVDERRIKIDANAAENGIYFLRIKDSEGTTTKKIVVASY